MVSSAKESPNTSRVSSRRLTSKRSPPTGWLWRQVSLREIARSVLPVATYSHMFASVNLLNLKKFLTLRCDAHAQYEIRVYADAMRELVRPIVPVCIEAWEGKSSMTAPAPISLRYYYPASRARLGDWQWLSTTAWKIISRHGFKEPDGSADTSPERLATLRLKCPRSVSGFWSRWTGMSCYGGISPFVFGAVGPSRIWQRGINTLVSYCPSENADELFARHKPQIEARVTCVAPASGHRAHHAYLKWAVRGHCTRVNVQRHEDRR